MKRVLHVTLIILSFLFVSCADVSFTDIIKGSNLPVTAVALEGEPLHTGYVLDSGGHLLLLDGISSTETQSVSLAGIVAKEYLSDGSSRVSSDLTLPSVQDFSLSYGTIILPVTIHGFTDKANDNTFAIHVFSSRGTINPFEVSVPFFEEQDMVIHALEMEARLHTGLSDYEIARTETTFTLWKEVMAWALENGYTFRALCGAEGSDGVLGNNDSGSGQPVAQVSLRDVRVWLNALSERDGVEPVYRTSNGNILRDSTDGWSCDNAVVDYAKNGWRLPTQKEYEFAARGGLCAWYEKSSEVPPYTTFPDDPDVTAYDFPYSGAKSEVFLSTYTVYNQYSSAPCASKRKNTLGIYDLSGNMAEWIDEGPEDGSGKHYIMGGSYDEGADECKITSREALDSAAFADRIGFRLARTR